MELFCNDGRKWLMFIKQEEKMQAQSLFSRRSTLVISMIVLAALVFTACTVEEIPATGANEIPEQEQPMPETDLDPAAPSDMEPAVGEAEISVYNDPVYGDILVGNNGMTLYIFTVDEPNTVNCTGDCLVNWPPLTTDGNPVLGPGVNPDLVGTAALPDGRTIVTYNQMPLYYWAADAQPGDTTGQGVGDVWYVVSPQGQVIQ
jgi:predicted lipoprotein with Yx(FWY)xxD motif